MPHLQWIENVLYILGFVNGATGQKEIGKERELTLVKILDDLCCLIFFTVWYTLTTSSVIAWSIKFDKAINTPVRPIPELISKIG